ncbi:MAG: metallophosphoesterase [Bacteroidota bacterium]
MKKLLLFLPFVFLVFLANGRILMKPYLQAVTTHSIYVLVECDSKDTVTVRFGLTNSYDQLSKTEIIAATTASPVTYVHKIKLAGLSASTRYYYRAFQGISTFPGSDFTTAVLPGTPFKFTWMADFRTGVGIHDSIAALLIESNSVVSLYGGDLCVTSAYADWKKEFFTPHQMELAALVPFFNTPGNHEEWGQNAKAFTQNPESSSGTQDFYSFDYGDLHVLSINYKLPYDEKSQQYKFAEKDLAASTKPWKIVICHAPAYCYGGHGNDQQMIKMTKDIFEKHGVCMILAGHTHFYQHNLVNGIHHLVIGSAGAPLYAVKKSRYTVKTVKDYNWAVGEVSPNRLTIKVYNANSNLLDVIDLKKD